MSVNGGAVINPPALPSSVLYDSQRSPLDLVGWDSRQAQFPNFSKYSGNPIFVGLGQTNSQLTTSAWNPASSNAQQWPITRPYVIRVDEILSSPLGKFYMYFSTDHATDYGGIGLAYANSPLGPWTFCGQVYQNTTSGASQTEWPSVIWDEDNSQLNLYHHVVGLPSPVVGGQVTCLATSTDGIHWTTYTGVNANGAVIDAYLSNGSNGNDFASGGFGYPSVCRLAGKWATVLFVVTSTYNRCGLAVSDDGRIWTIDPRYLGDLTTYIQGAASTAPTTHFLALNNTFCWWGGRLWTVTLNSEWVSGTTPNPDTFLAGPLSDDLRLFRAKPKQCVASTLQAWETTFFKIGSVLAYEGSLYLYYRSGNPIQYGGAGENFGVAVATPGTV